MRVAAVLAAAVPALCKDVKVLSWVSTGAGIADVNNQHKCFNQDLIKGVTIRGTKAKSVQAADLEGYDVLLMPGGSESECNNKAVDNAAIRAWVKAGGGYYGTCAGAFCGCESITPETGVTNASYLGVGLGATIAVSRAQCKHYSQVGALMNKFTETGIKIFGQGDKGDVKVDHHNGPAMTANGATVAATFSSGKYSGKASFVVDNYGSGRSVLISPHPEHPDGTDGVNQNCGLVAHAAAYAGGAIDLEGNLI